MSSSYPEVGHHKCTIFSSIESENPLVEQGPRRLKERYKARACPTFRHPACKYLFRSASQLLMEKKRIVNAWEMNNFYAIHPYSVLALWQAYAMTACYMYNYFNLPYVIAWSGSSGDADAYLSATLQVPYTIIMIINIYMNFHFGYFEHSEIVLDKKKIRYRYLTTYFIVDLLDILPVEYLFLWDEILFLQMQTIHLITYARFSSFLQYFRVVLTVCRVKKVYHNAFTLLLSSLVVVQIGACTIYGQAYYFPEKKIDDLDKIPGSYFSESRVSRKTPITKYTFQMHKVLCHFLRAGAGMDKIRGRVALMVYSTMMIYGFYAYTFMIIFLLDISRRKTQGLANFQMLRGAVMEFMVNRDYPTNLIYRVYIFMKYKYHDSYYDEAKMMRNLSEHLRYEVLLYSNYQVLKNIEIFKGQPKHVIGNILASIESAIYLPNDVILKANDKSCSIIIITFGTVAYYKSNGDEYKHGHDGDVVGCAAFMTGKSPYTCIAIETTEVLLWGAENIERYKQSYEEILERLANLMQDEQELDSYTRVNRKDFADMLSRGMIVEKRVLRRGRRGEYVA